MIGDHFLLCETNILNFLTQIEKKKRATLNRDYLCVVKLWKKVTQKII